MWSRTVGLGSIVTDNGTQIRNVERGISLIPLRNLHSGMHCSVKSKYLKSTFAVWGTWGVFYCITGEHSPASVGPGAAGA